MFEIYKICGVAILGITLSVVLKTNGSPISQFVPQITAIVILITSVTALAPFVSYIKGLVLGTNVKNDVIYIIVTASVVALISKTVADICNENGSQMLKNSVEFAGNAQIMLLCLPLFKELMSGIMEIVDI